MGVNSFICSLVRAYMTYNSKWAPDNEASSNGNTCIRGN